MKLPIELQEIAEDVVQFFKASAIKAVSDRPVITRANSFERTIHSYLSRQRKYPFGISLKKQLLDIKNDESKLKKYLGRYSKFDVKERDSLIKLNQLGPEFIKIPKIKDRKVNLLEYHAQQIMQLNDIEIRKIEKPKLEPAVNVGLWKIPVLEQVKLDSGITIMEAEIWKSPKLEKIPLPAVEYSHETLSFVVDKVVCDEETDNEWFSDEINMSATLIDAVGNVENDPEWEVYDNFDKDDIVQTNHVVKKFNLRDGGDYNWPKTYTIYLAMAEKGTDNGFVDFMNDIWVQVKSTVQEKLEGLIDSAAIVIGAAIPYVGWAVGLIFKAVAGWVLDKIIGLISQLLDNKDRPFVPQTNHLVLPGPMITPPGVDLRKKTSFEHHFKGYGGHYDVHTYWDLDR